MASKPINQTFDSLTTRKERCPIMLTLMRVSEVLELPSIEYDYVDSNAGITTAGEVIQRMSLDSHHDAIMAQMRIDGINAVPIHVASVATIADDYYDKRFGSDAESALGMGNGHHRLKMTVELGFKYILTSDDIMDTGEADDPVMPLDETMLSEDMFS